MTTWFYAIPKHEKSSDKAVVNWGHSPMFWINIFLTKNFTVLQIQKSASFIPVFHRNLNSINIFTIFKELDVWCVQITVRLKQLFACVKTCAFKFQASRAKLQICNTVMKTQQLLQRMYQDFVYNQFIFFIFFFFASITTTLT